MSDSFSGLRVSTIFAGLFLFALQSGADPKRCAEVLANAPPTGSASAKFLWLENDSRQRTDWIREQNHETNAAMKASANAPVVGEWMRKLFAEPIESLTTTLGNGQNLKVVYRGLGKGMDLVLESPGKDPEILFSNKQISKKLTTTFLDLAVSPDKNLILITSVENGSLDDYSHRVYDLSRRSVVASNLSSSSKEPVWAPDGASFYASRWESETNTYNFYRMNLRGKVLENLSPGGVVSRMSGWSVIGSKTLGGNFLISADGKMSKTAEGIDSLVGVVKNQMYFLSDVQNLGEVRKVPLNPTDGKVEVVIPKSGRRITNVKILGDYLVFQSEIGNDRKTIVAQMDGVVISEIVAPPYAIANALKWEIPGQRLIINLNSTIVKPTRFVYDLQAKVFIDGDKIEAALLTVEGIPFTNEVVEATSIDGTKIPVRLTYRKDLAKNGENGALIEVYGGFNLEGYLRSRPNMMNLKFVMDGGVLVHPAVRGGNELGPDWWKSAALLNKTITLDDITATSDLLSSLQLSRPEKVVGTGTSNGGAMIAAAGLRAKRAFGLVIPVNGVEDMLHKEVIDRRMGLGWSYEYGNSTQAEFRKYLASYGGVEQALVKDAPNFFILNGQKDSRVNPINSWKLAAALSERNVDPEKIKMAVINNSGHWVAKIGYQDQAAWRANTLVWTTIYDFLGMKF